MRTLDRTIARRAAARLWPATLGMLVLLSPAARAADRPIRQPSTAPHADGPEPAVERVGARQGVSMEAGTGRVLQLPTAAANVFVADPKVAEVRPASTNSLFVFGVGPGRTTVAAMNSDGQPVSQIEVTVRPSTYASGEAEAMVARLVPNGRIRVTPQARGVVLTGSVESPAEAARAVAILRGFLPEGQLVDNQLSVRASIQVNMRVRVVEMQRSVTRALGVDWQALGQIGRSGVAFATGTGLGQVASSAAGSLTVSRRDVLGLNKVDGIIDSLAQDNLVRILAEPNLTVMSGQPGSFLAGGEFPVPVAQSPATAGAGSTITVSFKKYGVSLDVVPTVLDDGRINLHVAPEVSQLTTAGAFQLASTSTTVGITVPGLTVRRAETSVELGSGQTFAIAGLMQDNIQQGTNGLAFMGDLPIIGPLFRSTSFQRQETELVILVTPYVVRPVDDPGRMHTATDHYTPPNDFERILLNRQMGQTGSVVQARIPGAAGFIVQ